MRKNKEESKITNKPSPKLQEILEINRLFPVNTPLPFGEGLINKTRSERGIDTYTNFVINNNPDYTWENFEGDSQQEKKIIEKEAWGRIRELSVKYNFEKVISYILEMFPVEEKYSEGDWIERYDDLRRMHQSLVLIAESAKDLSNFGKRKVYQSDKYFSLALTITVGLDGKGRMNFLNNPVAEALQGANPVRLQSCPVCKYVFWAYRLNQKWCSKKCADVHSQRERRADERKREEINEARRRNYAFKTAIKKGKNNGSL